MNKPILALLLTAALILAAGCSREPSRQQQLTHWLEAAALDAHDTPQQLYEQALEEGPLVVYTESTRIFQVKDSFEAQYPGLTVDVHHMRGAEVHTRLKKNAELGTYHCDVAICSDSNGMLTAELLPQGILQPYIPWDIEQAIYPRHRDGQLEYITELYQIYYNSDFYSEPPVRNWWQLTEPAWRGRVIIADPVASQSSFSLFVSVLQNSALMAQAYEDLYGSPLAVPEGKTAAIIFWEKLLDNGLLFSNTGTDAVELVGSAPRESSPLAVTVSSQVRNADLTYQVALAFDIEPFTGVYHPYCAMLAAGGENTAAAKLFIRWVLGETDGSGKGYDPYRREGVWPVRSDIPTPGYKTLDHYTLLSIDKLDIYYNRESYFELWNTLLQ